MVWVPNCQLLELEKPTFSVFVPHVDRSGTTTEISIVTIIVKVTS
jgi:hypothetical protein